VAFITGHSNAGRGFSTRTSTRTSRGEQWLVEDVETFAVRRDGQAIHGALLGPGRARAPWALPPLAAGRQRRPSMRCPPTTRASWSPTPTASTTTLRGRPGDGDRLLAHARRYFLRTLGSEPDRAREALALIGEPVSDRARDRLGTARTARPCAAHASGRWSTASLPDATCGSPKCSPRRHWPRRSATPATNAPRCRASWTAPPRAVGLPAGPPLSLAGLAAAPGPGAHASWAQTREQQDAQERLAANASGSRCSPSIAIPRLTRGAFASRRQRRGSPNAYVRPGAQGRHGPIARRVPVAQRPSSQSTRSGTGTATGTWANSTPAGSSPRSTRGTAPRPLRSVPSTLGRPRGVGVARSDPEVAL
jgi:hypothetical protein